jgi:hypothetical protein
MTRLPDAANVRVVGFELGYDAAPSSGTHRFRMLERRHNIGGSVERKEDGHVARLLGTAGLRTSSELGQRWGAVKLGVAPSPSRGFQVGKAEIFQSRLYPN